MSSKCCCCLAAAVAVAAAAAAALLVLVLVLVLVVPFGESVGVRRSAGEVAGGVVRMRGRFA